MTALTINEMFLRAVSEADNSLVEDLLKKGADVNHTTKEGNTALMITSYQGYSHIVKTLINHGASLDLQNEDGQTAVMFAARSGMKDLVEALVDHGANVKIQDDYGRTCHGILLSHQRI